MHPSYALINEQYLVMASDGRPIALALPGLFYCWLPACGDHTLLYADGQIAPIDGHNERRQSQQVRARYHYFYKYIFIGPSSCCSIRR